MIEAPDVKPWLFLIKPYEGESLSHFLGRFRRANHLSASGLGTLAGIGAIVARWERFHFNPRPSQQELEANRICSRSGCSKVSPDVTACWSGNAA